MMKKLLFTLFLFAALNMSAQTTHNISWGFGSNPTASGDFNTNRTIAAGDTVIWNWYGDGSHNVVSLAGGTESFNSGGTINSTTNTFSFTFNSVGSTDFRCAPHASMNGTITVQTLSNPEFEAPTKFSIFPNPGNDVMKINVPSLTDTGLKLEVYNVLGKRVFSETLSSLSSEINIAKWNSGLYLVRLSSPTDDIILTKRFVKL